MSSYFLFPDPRARRLTLHLRHPRPGLVLKYRSAGVVDFAHGAVAMFIAYVFINLAASWGALEAARGVDPRTDLAERRGAC